MKSSSDLRKEIQSIDHRSYPAYKQLAGSWKFEKYILNIDHVQGDPFAAPSSLSLEVSGRTAGFPAELYKGKNRKVSLEDALVRRFGHGAQKAAFKAKGSGKSGLIGVSRPGQEVLERTACSIDGTTGDILFRFEAGFPANGRTINAGELIRILFDFVPGIVDEALIYRPAEAKWFRERMELADNQEAIRAQMKEKGLAAFVADGSILPRESGVSQKPMKNGVPFRSPESLRVELTRPHHGPVTGMGIREGVTLIVGGAYHGKSTLLEALQLGVYNHIAGDGREYVLTDESAVKIRAEDGRSITGTDISLFINGLPGDVDCRRFSTANASGSTSQAAGTIEAVEAGAKLLLIDEDTCATNFMIRDELMAEVVAREEEPITPFLEKIRPLYSLHGISTILVAGSSGSFFHAADTVIQMDHYLPKDITEKEKKAAARYPAPAFDEKCPLPDFHRVPVRMPASDGRVKVKTFGKEAFSLDKENVDLRGLEQLVDPEQTQALGWCLYFLSVRVFGKGRTLSQAVLELEGLLKEKGLKALSNSPRTVPHMAMPRKQEIFACVDRWRMLKVEI